MNLNDIVSVKLTKYGKLILEEHKEKLVRGSGLEFTHLKQNEEGEYSSELWDIMYIFGKYMFMGGNQVFVNNEINIK